MQYTSITLSEFCKPNGYLEKASHFQAAFDTVVNNTSHSQHNFSQILLLLKESGLCDVDYVLVSVWVCAHTRVHAEHLYLCICLCILHMRAQTHEKSSKKKKHWHF